MYFDGIFLIRADQNSFLATLRARCVCQSVVEVQRRFLVVRVDVVDGVSASAVSRVLSLIMAEVRNWEERDLFIFLASHATLEVVAGTRGVENDPNRFVRFGSYRSPIDAIRPSG